MTAAALLAVAAAGAQAADAGDSLKLRLDTECRLCSRAAMAPGSSEAIVITSVNLEPRGELVVLIAQDGDILVRQGDLAVLGLTDLRYSASAVEGAPYVSLRSVERLEYHLDLSRLELQIRVEAQALARRQVIDLTPPRAGKVIYPPAGGGFLNYNLTGTGNDVDGMHALDAAAEIGVHAGDFLFLSDGIAGRDRLTGRDQFTRLSTSLISDNRQTLERLVIGDFLSPPASLGSSLRLGGISFSRRFSLDPYLVRFPGQIVSGSATLPSEVLLYSNGVLVRRERVQPGQFELQNLVTLPGLQVTEVVIRDVLGNEQRISDPYYFSDSLLKVGLDEYSFDAGLERQLFGTRSNQYGNLGAAGFYRRGVTDWLTLGARGESLDGRTNFGPLATVRLGLLGVASAAYGRGRSDDGRSGQALFLSHAFAASRFSSSLALRTESREYPRAAASLVSNRRYEFSAALGYALANSASVGLVHVVAAPWIGERRRSTALTFRQRLARDLSYSVTLRQTNEALIGNELMFGLAYAFDALGERQSAYAQAQRNDQIRSNTLQVTGGNPDAAGLHYRATLEHSSGAAGKRDTLYPFVQYSFPHFVARGEYFRDSASSRDTYQAGISGSIASVGGQWGFARPIYDSFGIVKLGDIEGVRVYANNTEVGRTASDGTVFIPRLASYFENPVAIEDKDLPIDAIVPEVRYTVLPSLRSGIFLDFTPRRVQAVAGRLVALRDGKPVAFGNVEGELQVAGASRPMYFSNDGSFYVEDVGEGEYAGRAQKQKDVCRFVLRVPKSSEPVLDLGSVRCQ